MYQQHHSRVWWNKKQRCLQHAAALTEQLWPEDWTVCVSVLSHTHTKHTPSNFWSYSPQQSPNTISPNPPSVCLSVRADFRHHHPHDRLQTKTLDAKSSEQNEDTGESTWRLSLCFEKDLTATLNCPHWAIYSTHSVTVWLHLLCRMCSVWHHLCKGFHTDE